MLKITQTIYDLLSQFNANWNGPCPVPPLVLNKDEIGNLDDHPLQCEIENLVKNRGATLPYFASDTIYWCTVAPNYTRLKKYVRDLEAWIIPSYGWQDNADGFLSPDPKKGEPQKSIAAYSTTNYFRW